MRFIMLTLTMLAVYSLTVFAAAPPKVDGPFKREPLPYALDALEPVIDKQTMEIHTTKHHQGYVDKLNAEVAKDQTLKGKSLEEIVRNVSAYNQTVRNNAGGHWNHSFYWTIMAPVKDSGAPSPELAAAIDAQFGSLADFKTAFEKAGMDRFGSGWVWLIVNEAGRLEIVSTPNQDNPLMGDAPVKGMPILGNDLWEHAYYLTYQNKRADYEKAWWGVVNWPKVSANYTAALKKYPAAK